MAWDVSSFREGGANVGLHRFAFFTACCTALLIFVGGLVTSTESGLSVPDWPTTYGWNMFTFPLEKWVGGIRFEHGHRLVASFVGSLTVILAIWTYLKEKRTWVRRLAFTALLAVILQGVLGGLTVIFLLPTPISMAHACLAQTFFCLTIALALFTSPGWKRGLPPIPAKGETIGLPLLSAMTTAAIYLQLIVGALMRHTNSGLAIPDFPLAFGRIVPPLTSEHVAIHFGHRIGAILVLVMITWTFARIVNLYSEHALVYRPALLMLGLVLIQIALGAFTVWTAKSVIITTAHVANGALILGTSLLLTLRAYGMVAKRRTALIYQFREPAWK
jgi:heme a synthase